MILLCVQNGSTQFNQEAMQGVKAFKADSPYGPGTEVVMLDPADKAEQHFLSDLQVDPRTTTAVTLLVTPPGAPVARFAGAVTRTRSRPRSKRRNRVAARIAVATSIRRRNHAIANARLAQIFRAQESIVDQFPGDPAGNHGDRVDREHLLLLRKGRGPRDGFAGGQRVGATQVVHLAGLLRGRYARRDDSRGIRHATGDVGPGQGSTTSRRNCRCPSNSKARPSRSPASCRRASFRPRPLGAARAFSRGPSAAGPRSA